MRRRTWDQVSQIEIEFPHTERSNYSLFYLCGDSVLCPVQCSDVTYADEKRAVYAGGKTRLLAYRSDDGGRSWQQPAQVCLWSGELGLGCMASGKILAVVRHQRALLPEDPPGIIEITGADKVDPTRPYKHIILIDSEDDGRTWKNFRQLTTVFGQYYDLRPA